MYHTAPLSATAPLHRQTLTVQFNAEQLTSNAGGALLLQQVDQKLQLTETITRLIHDPRDPRYTSHQQRDLLAQRIYAIALGDEDVNDHRLPEVVTYVVTCYHNRLPIV